MLAGGVVGHWLLHFFGLDSASGPAYLAWSGIVSDAGLFAAASAFIAHAIVSYRKINCHVRGCPRIGRHHVEGTPYVVCRKHAPEGAPTHQDVINAHHAARRCREHGHGG